MKFVHIADVHFDMPFTLLSSRGNMGDKRRLEQREAFDKVINYIKENDIEYFLFRVICMNIIMLEVEQ